MNYLQPEFFHISRKTFDTEDTFTLELIPSKGKTVSFAPGQFNMLYVFGIGEVPISITGDPKNNHSFIHTIKIVGNVTKALSRLKEGDPVGLRGPFGTSWPAAACKGKNLVIMGGGIGLAPLRPMIYHLLSHREDFGSIALLYGTRQPSEIVFSEELKAWKKAFDNQVFITVDFAPETWKGNIGVVTTLIPRIHFDFTQAAALLCGPEIMLRFSVSDLVKRGLPEPEIYLAMERNMKCALGHCGRCQYVDNFICKDGSIVPYSKVKPFFAKKEI